MQHAGLGPQAQDGRHLHAQPLGVREVVVVPLGHILALGLGHGQVAQLAEALARVRQAQVADAGVAHACHGAGQRLVGVVVDDQQLAAGVALAAVAVDGAQSQGGAAPCDKQAGDEGQLGGGRVLVHVELAAQHGAAALQQTDGRRALLARDRLVAPAVVPVVQPVGVAGDCVLLGRRHGTPALVAGDRVEPLGGLDMELGGAGVAVVGVGEHVRPGGAKRLGGLVAGHQLPEDMLPERVAALRGDQGVAEHVRQAGGPGKRQLHVGGRLQANQQAAPGQQRVERAQRLVVEVGVEPTKVKEQEVARGVHAHNRVGVALVDRQEPGVVRVEESPQILVGPEPILPAGVVRAPGLLVGSPLGGKLGALPGLVDDARDAGGRSGAGRGLEDSLSFETCGGEAVLGAQQGAKLGSAAAGLGAQHLACQHAGEAIGGELMGVHGSAHAQLQHAGGVEELVVAEGLDEQRAALAQGAGERADPAVLDGAGDIGEEPGVGEEIGEEDARRVHVARQLLGAKAGPATLHKQRVAKRLGGAGVGRKDGGGVGQGLAAEAERDWPGRASHKRAQRRVGLPRGARLVVGEPEAGLHNAGGGGEGAELRAADLGAAGEQDARGKQLALAANRGLGGGAKGGEQLGGQRAKASGAAGGLFGVGRVGAGRHEGRRVQRRGEPGHAGGVVGHIAKQTDRRADQQVGAGACSGERARLGNIIIKRNIGGGDSGGAALQLRPVIPGASIAAGVLGAALDVGQRNHLEAGAGGVLGHSRVEHSAHPVAAPLEGLTKRDERKMVAERACGGENDHGSAPRCTGGLIIHDSCYKAVTGRFARWFRGAAASCRRNRAHPALLCALRKPGQALVQLNFATG